MNERSVFHLIAEVTKKEGLPCLLIGGYAVNYYKVSRQTGDVDFLITRKDFDKISSVLRKAGYKEMIVQDNFAQFESTRISLQDVDFMFVDEDTLDKILKDSQKIKLVKKDFLVPSLNHLIALKLHAIKGSPKLRLIKDLPDIINLIRVNKIAFEKREFKELCLKYGTEEIYNRILEALK